MYLLFQCICPRKSSMGHLFRCGSLVLFSGPTQVLHGSLVSMWIICSLLIRSHTSPLWVACFVVDHQFFIYQVPHKSSMGRLFRCGSPILLLSGSTQALYGSLASVWITCSLLYVHVCVCMCMHVYRKFVQGNYSPCHLTPVGGSKWSSSSLGCR